MRAVMSMRAVLLGLLIAVATLAALTVGAVLLIESEWAEQQVEEYATQRLGRSVAIEGIDLRLAWPPRIGLAALRIANPDWAHAQHLIDAQGLVMTIEARPLLERRLVLDLLEVQVGEAGLERRDGQATWHFEEGSSAGGGQGGEPRFELQELHVRDALIHYRNTPEDTVLRIDAQGSLDGGEIRMHASGRYRGEPARASARAPSLLLSADQAIRLRFDATIGHTSGKADGMIRSSTSGLRAIDAQLELSGLDLAGLQNLLGINFPATPPYRVKGRLLHDPDRWALEGFDGHVGDSDLRGSWSYERGGMRPLFRAELQPSLLDLDDLGPILGAPPGTGRGETASAEQAREAKRRGRGSKVLPQKPFHRARWDAMDANVRYQAERILHAPAVPLDWLKVHAVLESGRLRLAPLSLGVAGGRLEGTAVLDSRQEPLQAQLDIEARSLQLGRLLPEFRSQNAAFGELYGRAKVHGTGDSVGALLGSSSGELALMVDGGSVSALLVEAIGLDLGEALLLLGNNDRSSVRLRCAVADFALQEGVARTDSFVVDTVDTLIRITGSIALGAERLNLVAHPQPRDASLLSARSPIVIGGTFKDPQIYPKADPLAARAAAAGLLALVNPLLALLPLIEPGTAPEGNCRKLLQQVREGGMPRR